jgi:peptide/nickel transport system permease protein
MLNTITRRLAWAVPTLVLVTFGVFALIDVAPGDAAQSLAGENASVEEIAEVRERLGLDEPLVVRYVDWLGDAVRGDLDRSLFSDEPVQDMILRALPNTISLAVVALALSTLIATVAGTWAAVRPGGIVDRLVSVGASVGIAVPTFLLGVVLVSQLAVRRSVFPALGYVGLTEDPWQWLVHLILPAIALCGVTTGELARQLRGALRDVLEQDYVLAAHAKGLPMLYVLRHHAMRNAAIPVVTVLGLRCSQLLGGTVIVEQIFLLRGIGSTLVTAVLNRDIPVVVGVAVVTTVIVTVINLLVDVSYTYLNPKLRYA